MTCLEQSPCCAGRWRQARVGPPGARPGTLTWKPNGRHQIPDLVGPGRLHRGDRACDVALGDPGCHLESCSAASQRESLARPGDPPSAGCSHGDDPRRGAHAQPRRGCAQPERAAAQMLELAPADAIGRTVQQLGILLVDETGKSLNPMHVLVNRVTRVGAAQHAVSAELVGISRPGQAAVLARWVHVDSRIVTSAHDGGQVILTTFADMTEPREVQAALARSEMQFRVAMENAPIGFLLVGVDWHLIEVNNAFAELVGASPAALRGFDFGQLLHPEDRYAVHLKVHSLLTGAEQRFSIENRYLRADGQVVWAMLDVALVRKPSGEPDHFVAQVRDTTESRLHAEMLAHRP